MFQFVWLIWVSVVLADTELCIFECGLFLVTDQLNAQILVL